MNFDPQKLLIGLMEVFSILLPSALLTWLLMGEVGPAVLGGSRCRAQRRARLRRLPVRELSLRSSGLSARLLAGGVLRLGPALLAERADHATRPPWPLLAFARHTVKGLTFKGKGSFARAQPLVRQTPVVLQVRHFVFFTAS